MSIMICLCGIPGSGKTTWAEKFLKKNPDFQYFSPDEYYRLINGDDCIRDNKERVWQVMCENIRLAERMNRNVLIDCDNSTIDNRNFWVERYPSFERYLLYFTEPFEVCMNRVQNRRRTIPEDFMRKKKSQFIIPTRYTDPEWTYIDNVINFDVTLIRKGD